MKTSLLIASLCSLQGVTTTVAWSNNNAPQRRPATKGASNSRRAFLNTAAKIVPLVLVSDAAFADDEPIVEASASEEPAASAAADVAAVVDETDFIAKLKARSEANREKNLKLSQSGDKLSARQFASQYDRPSFIGVHNPSNSEEVTMYLKEDFDKLLASGKVKQTYESKVNKKTGEISDDYSKPIYVFAN